MNTARAKRTICLLLAAAVMCAAAAACDENDAPSDGTSTGSEASSESGKDVTDTDEPEITVTDEEGIPADIYDQMTTVYDSVPEQERENSFNTDEVMQRYGFSQLNKYEKQVYLELLDGFKNFETTIQVSQKLQPYELQRVKSLLMTEDYSLYYLNNEYSIYRNMANGFASSVEVAYTHSPTEINVIDLETERAATRLIQQLQPTMNNYDVVKYFHDYLILNCTYDEAAEYNHMAYGALVDGKAVCEGYAKAFAYLCDRVGIENLLVTGMSADKHMWNMVKIDGEWYHIDVTQDDLNKELLNDLILYEYFLANDKIVKSHMTIDTDLYVPPVSNGTRYYYFNRENTYITGLSDIDSKVKSTFIRASKAKQSYVQFKFSSDELNDVGTDLLLDDLIEGREGSMHRLLSEVNSETGMSIISVASFQMKSYRLLIFRINYPITPAAQTTQTSAPAVTSAETADTSAASAPAA